MVVRLVDDKEELIARNYGVQRMSSGHCFRSMVLIDKEGLVVANLMMDLSMGVQASCRLVRILKA